MSVQRRYFMEYKKSRWELKYETFKSGSIDNDLKTLNDKKVKFKYTAPIMQALSVQFIQFLGI